MQQTVSKDILARHPHLAERERHPGPDSRDEPGHRLRQHHGDAAGRRRGHPRRARQRFADLCGWHEHGLGRQRRRRREHAAGVGGAGSRADHLRRPGRSGDSRRGGQRHSARGRPTTSAASSSPAARTARCRGTTTRRRSKTRACKTPSELISVYDVNPMGGGRLVRDKLWFYAAFRQVGAKNTVPGMWVNKNAGNPNAWTVDFDKTKQAFSRLRRAPGDHASDVAGDAAKQVQFPLGRAVQRRELQRGRHARRRRLKRRAGPTTSRRASPHASWSSPVSGRLLLEAGWGMYQARYRFGIRNDGTHNPLMIRVTEQTGVGNGDIPGLAYRMPTAPGPGGFTMSLIGTLAAVRASASYITGAHNMKFGYQGGFSNPSQTYDYFTRVKAYPGERRRTEPADADHRDRQQHQVRPQPPAGEFLRAGSVDPQPADAAGRPAVRLPEIIVSRLGSGRPGVSVRPERDLLSGRVDARVWVEGHHAARGRGLRSVRERQDGRQVQHREIHGSHHGVQQRPGHESAVSHDHPDDARVDRLEPRLRAELRSEQLRASMANARPWTTRPSGRACSTGRWIPAS